jgi:hypothetical protein
MHTDASRTDLLGDYEESVLICENQCPIFFFYGPGVGVGGSASGGRGVWDKPK